ncbi:MAG: hypothetical protein D6800_09170 [Candidatus Zixiibacteriota bacterium]|nr:MAG: hypothetical protein D6800_09170 [candidate division Zixibacteria bacterium]
MMMSKGKYAEAVKTADLTARIDSTFPDIHLLGGAALLRMGRYDAATVELEKEINLHPGRPDAYTDLGTVMLQTGDMDSARALALAAIDRRPSDITANRLLIRATRKDSTASLTELEQTVQTALTNTDSNLYVLNEGVEALVLRGDLSFAEPLVARGLAVRPPPIETDDLAFGPDFPHAPERFERERARTYYYHGLLAALRNHPGVAVTSLSAAIARDSTLAEAYLNLIAVLKASGQFTRADSVLTTARRLFPHDQRF